MKKSLITLAIAGSFAATANAQTAVSMYGIVDMGLVSERGGAAGSVQKVTSGAQSGTRLGVKGTEDLGGNLKGLFVLETGIAADQGGFNQGGVAFARQSFVGLQGDFGTVTLGRQYTPYFLTLNGVDPFASGMAGAALNVMANSGIRMNNTIKYASPIFGGGISGDLAYGFGEIQGDSSARRQIGGSIGYAVAPFTVRLAHHNKGNVYDTGTSKSTMLAATWDLTAVKVFAAFADHDGAESSPTPVLAGLNPASSAAAVITPFGTQVSNSAKSRDFLIGASVPFGSHTFIASYIRKDDRTAANRDANQFGLGYTYTLSKRTNIYAAWASIDNKNGASYTVGNNSEAGSGDSAFNLGVRHIF